MYLLKKNYLSSESSEEISRSSVIYLVKFFLHAIAEFIPNVIVLY